MGKSKHGHVLRMSAGARLTVILDAGNRKLLLFIAERKRSLLS
jgi:hypothetical protein